MENVDKSMENRVWQRVKGQKAPPDMPLLQRDNLKPWILSAQENTVALRNLQLQLIGKQWEALRRLEHENLRLIHLLQGVSALRGEIVRLTPLTAPKDQPRRALEKCFHRSRRLWEEMERRCTDPEFGMVFSGAMGRCGDHCTMLAELIGRLDG